MLRRAAVVGALCAATGLALAPVGAAPVVPVQQPLPAVLNLDALRNPTWNPSWAAGGSRGPAVAWPADWPRPRLVRSTARGPLSGRVIAVDPGHNSGNWTHLNKLGGRYWVGLEKACNTTGTTTPSGYKESAYTWDVSLRLAARLAAEGATVVLTRNTDSRSTYGPCIQARGLLAGQVGAHVLVSVHADGAPGAGRGAFVFSPSVLPELTSSTKAAASRRLAQEVLAGLAGRGLGGSQYMSPDVQPDRRQGTINTSARPAVIVETLNMRDWRDAQVAESEWGRQRVADGIADGLLRYFPPTPAPTG